MNRRTFLSLAATIGVGAGLVLAGCGDDTDEAAGSSGDAITVEGAWARTSPMMADAGAAYFTITSATDDALLSASVDSAIAGKVETARDQNGRRRHGHDRHDHGGHDGVDRDDR